MRNLLITGLILLNLSQADPGYSQTVLWTIRQDSLYSPSNHSELINLSTADGFKSRNKNHSSLYLPISSIAYGFIGLESDGIKKINFDTREEILEHHPFFQTSVDNYLQFTPVVATFVLKISGKQSEHEIWESAKLYATSTLLMASTVYAVKSITHVQRPDGSTFNSFPSGHTATAFAAAEFMHQEFKNSVPVLSYSGYIVASATGALRMYNNKHYLTDVLTGAGIGILTTKAGYWINKKLFTKH